MFFSPDFLFRSKSRNVARLIVVFAMLSVAVARAGTVPMAWDGSTALRDIDFRPENFLDINSYQFRPSEDIRWYDVENGWRVAGGSLERRLAMSFSNRLMTKYGVHKAYHTW